MFNLDIDGKVVDFYYTFLNLATMKVHSHYQIVQTNLKVHHAIFSTMDNM